MNTHMQEEEINENQSIRIIREMIDVSRKRFSNDGILFIIWGWIFFTSAVVRYLLRKLIVTQEITSYANNILLVLLLFGIIFSVNYIYKSRQKVKTYPGQILRYLWGAIIFLNLYILVFQLRSSMNIDALMTQYMLMLAVGTFVTAAIIRFKPMIWTSISFIVLAQVSVFFLKLDISILIAALSFITGLVVPGHILYAGRKKA